MIINPEVIQNKFRCNVFVAEYLTKNYNLPILAIEDDYVYFTDNNYLKECLKTLPFFYKIMLYTL